MTIHLLRWETHGNGPGSDFGDAIAQELKKDQIDGVILTYYLRDLYSLRSNDCQAY